MAPDNGGRVAIRSRRRAVASTGTPPGSSASPRAATRLTPTRLAPTRRTATRLAAAGAALACAALVVTGCTQRGTPVAPVALLTTTQGSGGPWTARMLPPQTPTMVPPGPPGTELPAEPSPVVTGDRRALYGGSADRPLCDIGRLAGDLEADPAKLSAWSEAAGVSDVRGYLHSLAPVLLRADTRVTSYGYEDASAAPREAILESGTVVLIDDHGTPRVRCAYGAPLEAPALRVDPDPHAVPWPGFESGRVVVVRPSLEPLTMVSVVDLTTGALIPVPVGAGPDGPAPAPPPPVAAPVVAQAPAPAPPGPGAPAPVDRIPRPAPAAAPPPVVAPPPPPPAPEPLPPAPPAPAPPAPAPPPRAPEPAVVPAPPPAAPPPEIRLEVPGLPPLVIPIPG